MADLLEPVSTRCAACEVRHTALCGALDDRDIAALSSIARRRRVAPGQVLLWAGDPNMICANLVDGVLKLSTAAPDGREQIVGLLFPGDFVGQPFVEEASMTVTALGEADLCIYPRAAFIEVLDHHAALERLLLRRAMAALDEARWRTLMLGRKSAGEKVASFILAMGTRIMNGIERPSFRLPLGRAQIADVLGLTIETVSRQMTQLKRDGAIALPGGRAISIVDRGLLAERAGVA